MPYDLESELFRAQIVRSFVLALNSLDIEPIIQHIHTEFMFKWYDNLGVRGELRFIGHLTKAFSEIKNEGGSVNAEFIWLEVGGYRFPSIKLLPAVDKRIIYPARWKYGVDRYYGHLYKLNVKLRHDFCYT